MSSRITGIDLEPLVIIGLALLALLCCFMFWLCVIKPVKRRFRFESVIADFRHEITEWEHDQQCR